MFVTAYDPSRLILVSVHSGDALTQAEYDGILDSIRRMAADGRTREAPVTALTLVETDKTLNALQRQGIATATNDIRQGYNVVVTTSVLARMVMTAIHWLTPSNSDLVQATFPAYEQARVWLVERTHHPATAFDKLLADVRARIAAASETSAPLAGA
jgi:hypothetical protein